MKTFQQLFPALEWIAAYRKEYARGDVIAGATVAIMLVPQAMAYAMLAGLPPVIGLYASTIPIIVYALFGSSRHLAVGPVAMISLLVYVGCSKIAEPGSPEYISNVLILAFMVGVIQLLFGVFRIGFIITFISHAVISGFTSAAAIIILLSQLKHLLGISLGSHHSVIPLLVEAVTKFEGVHIITMSIGVVSIGLLLLLKKIKPRFPAPLLIVVATTLLVYMLSLDKSGVEAVGEVPRGLPGITVPAFDVHSFNVLLPVALTIMFVGFMESIAVAEMVASRKKYKISPNKEFVGLGLSNISASFFSGYPVTGGFSRTAVNYQAGARTGLASIITAALMVLTLLFFTPLFYYLPKTVLAAIIMVAVVGLIDFKEAVRLYKIKKTDAVSFALTFIVTLTIGIEIGIITGVVFSLLVFIWRSAHPHAARLGYLEEKGVFRNLDRFPEARTFPDGEILRVDASLYFANVGLIEDLMRREILDRPDIRWVIFDLSGVNDIDAVAISRLEDIIDNYQQRGVTILFAEMKGPVRDLISRAGWDENYPSRISHPSISHALKSVEKNNTG